MPIEPALIFVNKTLISLNIRDKIRVICSGNNLRLPILRAIATGADTQQRQRFYVLLGCIQKLSNNNTYPTGVASQDKMLMKGLVVTDKSERIFDSTKHLTSSK
jgi:glutamate synthase domain-containing protein 2